MFAQPSYTFIEDRGVGTIVVTKSGTSSEDFQVRVVGGKKSIIFYVAPRIGLGL